MTKSYLRLLIAATLAAGMPLPSHAAGFDDVRTAIEKSDLAAALNAARVNATDNPSDAVAQQVYGILEMAAGDPRDAEKAFTAAIEQGDAMDPTPTGLEKLDYDASVLHQALDRQKVSIALDAGGASAYNNRAAARIAQGHIEDAFSDLDDAMRRRRHWGKPSANAAVAWLESNSPRKAKQFANQALNNNEATAKVYTTLGEAQTDQRFWKDADASFKEAEERDRSYPYELYQRARWYHDQGQIRDEQRSMFQAIALDPRVADEDRYTARNNYSANGGTSQNDSEHLFNLGRIAGNSFQTAEQRDRGLAEDRTGSYQRRDFSQTIFGTSRNESRTGVFTSFLNENGGRPGGVDQFTLPDATFGFRRANVALFQNFSFGHGSELMVEPFYRHDNIVERSSSSAPVFQPLTEDQYGLEWRYQRPIARTHELYFGYSWMETNRSLGYPPAGDPLSGPNFTSPLEPNEQVLPNGKNSQTTVYAITQQPASSKVTTAYGPIVASRGKSVFVLPYFDVHYASSAHISYRFAGLPRMMNANSDLLPIWTLSPPLGTTPTQTQEIATNDFNQNPFIEGQDGRAISLELTQTQLLHNTSWLSTTAFHREFSDIDVLSQDPNLSPTLLLTHLPHGSTTGVTATYTQPLPAGLSIDLGGTLQTSHGSLPLPGAPSLNSLPYVPNLNGLVGLNYGQGTWDVNVHTIHIGGRKTVEQSPLPTGIGVICGRCNYQVATVAPMTIVNVTVTHHLPDGQDIVFIIQPVSSSGFYYNYPTKPSFSFGYNYHY